jgi:hypothetical protein
MQQELAHATGAGTCNRSWYMQQELAHATGAGTYNFTKDRFSWNNTYRHKL